MSTNVTERKVMSVTTGTVTYNPALAAGFLAQMNGALLQGSFDKNTANALGMRVVGKIGNRQNAIGLPAYFMHNAEDGILFCMNGEEGDLSLDELKNTVETSARELGLLQ